MYGSDLAYVHHVAFSGLSQAAASWLCHELPRRGHNTGVVVDLGCGSGELAAGLLAQGFDVVGVDASAAMIALARRTAPGARFVTGSLFRTEVPTCCAVTAIGEALNYVPPDSRALPRLPALFRRVFRSLERGGIFVFDIVERSPTTRLAPMQRHLEGRDWAVLIDVAARRWPNRLERRITLFRERDGSFRRSREVHRLRLLDRSTVQRQLRAAGFRVRVFKTYGSTRLLPSRVGFLASKPG